MSYIDDTGDISKLQSGTYAPWPDWPPPHSFRTGMTPAVCNNWYVDGTSLNIACGDTFLGDSKPRIFKQAWTSTYVPFDAPTSINNQPRGKKSKDDHPWDIDQDDTARSKDNGTWSWEVFHVYNQKGGGWVEPSDNEGNYFRQDMLQQYAYDVAHRVILDNWSESNAVAGAFLSHPDHLTRPHPPDVPPDDVSDFYDWDQRASNPNFFHDMFDWKALDTFRRGDFLFRVQGMQDSISLYLSKSDAPNKSPFSGGLSLATTNPTAKAQDFSCGGFENPVLTMANNPFWRADPSQWAGILENLNMDMMPYYAPTRKTRPVMYRFWAGEYSTALYGGPVFKCHTAGPPQGDMSVANVPYYRKFLRDFMASDDTIMRWRDSIGLKPNEDARYPHNYANYWKVVNELKARCFVEGKKDIHNLWADDITNGLTPTEIMSDWSYQNSGVGSYLNPTMRTFTPTVANHFVLRNGGVDFDSLIQNLTLPSAERTLAYPASILGDPNSKMSMYLKRKVHSTNMHATNNQAFLDYYATFFNDGTDNAALLSHKIQTDTLGVVSDHGAMLSAKFMRHILKNGDMSEALPEEIAQIDMDSIQGWWNNELLQTIYAGLVSYKSDQIKEFMKWSLQKGATLAKEFTEAFSEFMKTVHPKLRELFDKLVGTLEDNLASVDTLIVDGESFAAYVGKSFLETLISFGFENLSAAKDSIVEQAKKFKDFLARSFFPPKAGSVFDKFAQMNGAPPSTYKPNTPFSGHTSTPMDGAQVDQAAVDQAIKDKKLPKAMSTVVDDVDVAAEAMEGIEEGAVALEAAEALTLSAVAVELAPIIILMLLSDLLDYFMKKAQADAEKAAAYTAAHDKQNAFYEAMVPLNTGFFNGDELSRLQTYIFNADSPLSSIRELLALEKADAGDTFGDTSKDTNPVHLFGLSDTETPWVRFDFLTKLVVMNYMSLSMVNKEWLKDRDLDAAELVARLRQSEWLSTCEVIRIMRVVDHSIQAPMWADTDFSAHSFPLTTLVPNGMIKEFMTPIPCVTPYDNKSMGLDVRKDLYGLIFGDHEQQAEVKREPSPVIPGKDVTQYDDAGSAYITQVLPDDAAAQVADDMKRAGITYALSRIELAWDVNGNGYVVYYYFHGKTSHIVTPESILWESMTKDPVLVSMYGQLPIPYVTFIETKNVLTGLPMTVANVVEPVPIFAPDRSPTMFVSSADSTYAWPTMRAQGGPMNYLAKELSYFQTHKFDLTGADGVDISTLPMEKTIGSGMTRLIVSRAPTVTIGSDKTVVVLTDSPEYTEAKWKSVMTALSIDGATIKFWRAHMDLPNVEWSKYDYPHPLRLLDMSNVPGMIYGVKPNPPILAAYDEYNHTWVPPESLDASGTPIPDGDWKIPPGILPDGAVFARFDIYTPPSKVGWAIEYFYTLPDKFPDADYIIDFASKIDWAAFFKPASTANQDESTHNSCGEVVDKNNYIIVSEGPFSLDNYTLFPLILRQLQGKGGLDKEYPVPAPLVPYTDAITNLCYWPYNGPPASMAFKLSSETIGGLTFTRLDGTGEFNVENMSALPITMFQTMRNLIENGTWETSLMSLATLHPGDVKSLARPDSAFAFVLTAEIEDDTGSLMEKWKEDLFYKKEADTVEFGRIDRSFLMKVSAKDHTNLLVLDNPKRLGSPKLIRLRARLAQILGAIEGVECYAILKYFIVHQFPMISLKPASKLQDDVCDWILRHVKITVDSKDGHPVVTPRKIGSQIGLYYVGDKILNPQNFDRIFGKGYDVESFIKKHPQFKSTTCDTVGPYGPPTSPRGGPLFVSTMSIRDGSNNPIQWANKYAYLAFDEDPERSELKLLLISIGNEAHLDNIGNNDTHVDDVLNNKHTDLEALPKCKARASQHDKLAGVLHMAERVRRLRVNALSKARSLDEDGALEDMADSISRDPTNEMGDAGTANLLTMIANLGTIRGHRTVKSKSAFYTLTNRQAICAQACKEVYKDERSGMRTATSHYCFVADISDLETAFFYNPHNRDLLVACRGTDVKKDLEKADIDESYLKTHDTHAPENVLSRLKRKFSAAFNPLSDLYTDFMIVVGRQGETLRHQNTLDKVKGVLGKYVVSSVTVAGHSLGGSIALFVHENLFGGSLPSQCVIFNGAIGLDQTYFDNVKATKAGKDIPWANAITSFHVGGSSSSIFTADPVSFLTGGIGKSDEQICVTGAGVPNRLQAHTIGNFITAAVELVAHETYSLPTKT